MTKKTFIYYRELGLWVNLTTPCSDNDVVVRMYDNTTPRGKALRDAPPQEANSLHAYTIASYLFRKSKRNIRRPFLSLE